MSPYFGLRSYQDGGMHYEGQIGSEATPAEFLDALLAATREMVRVLKPSGSLFINLGDKYSGGRNGPQGETGQRNDRAQAITYGKNVRDIQTDIPGKSLMGIPWRYAINCIDQLGLILRAEIIWAKPNGLPESVTDRVRRNHEQWFHFVRQPRYFSAVDEIREEHQGRLRFTPQPLAERTGRVLVPGNTPRPTPGPDGLGSNPLGKLPGSVWTINEGESLVRSVLTAVSAGGITVDEGERILACWTQYGSGQTPKQAKAAGTGQGYSTLTDTADTTVSQLAATAHPESPMNSPMGQSQTDFTSTTSAETNDASTPTTSSPSPTQSTAPAYLAANNAPMDTLSTKPILTSELAEDENAVNVWLPEHGDREQSSGPPSIWVIPTQPLSVPPELGVDHFAAYPMEFPRRIIQGWTPNGICTGCGEGRRPAKDVDWSKVPHQMVLKRILTDAQITRWVSQFRVICDNHNITARAINEALGTATNGSGRGGAFTGRAGHWEIPTPEMWERMNAALGPFPVELEELVYATQLVPVSLIDSGNDTATTGRHQTDGHRRMSSAEYRTITGYMCACTPYTDHPERRGKDFLAGADRTKAGRSANSSERNRAYREGTSGPSGPIHEYHLEDWTPAPTTPAVVLDPFGGTGTTALVAKALGRIGITIDLSADYCRLAEWRCNDPRELAAALQVEKPEPIHPDQLDLFSES